MKGIWMNPTLENSCGTKRNTLKICKSASTLYLSLTQLSCLIHHISLWERNLHVEVIFMCRIWVHSTATKAHQTIEEMKA